MGRSAWILASAAAVALVAANASVLAQREQRQRSILVSVAGSGDAPVTNMTETDFIVRENGVAREVLRVSAAPPPTHVLLLVDDSQVVQTAVPYLRSALAVFIKQISALTPRPQQALMTFGERPMRRTDFTPNTATVANAAARIFAMTGSGAYFMQAIMEACQDLRKRSAPSPVIVAFVAEGGPEFSNSVHSQVADALRAAGASLWVIVLQQGSQPVGTPEARERAAVIGDVTTDSGGMNKVVLAGQGLESAFGKVRALLASRYLVTYGRPDTLVPPDRIEVESRRPGVRVRSSKWAGR